MQYQFTSGSGSPVNVTLPGIFGGTMSPNSTATYTFDADARQGRTMTGTASQDGNQISINFTTSCNLSSGNSTPNQPTNPPSNSGSCSVSSPYAAVDVLNSEGVSGWALDAGDFAKTLTIDVYVNGVKVASGPANDDRSDLIGAFGNNPAARYHGFHAKWSYNRSGTNTYPITIKICGVSTALREQPITFSSYGNPLALVAPAPMLPDVTVYDGWSNLSGGGINSNSGSSGRVKAPIPPAPFWSINSNSGSSGPVGSNDGSGSNGGGGGQSSGSTFYAAMQARGITFTDEEKAVLNDYPALKDNVRAYQSLMLRSLSK